jgi:AmiR/NasT family two-component response regulator
VSGLHRENSRPARQESPHDNTAAASATVADLAERLRAAEARADGLQRALLSNRRIGMAIGILLTRHLTEEQAFDLLRRSSMQRNIKLRDLAEEVIYRGTL